MLSENSSKCAICYGSLSLILALHGVGRCRGNLSNSNVEVNGMLTLMWKKVDGCLPDPCQHSRCPEPLFMGHICVGWPYYALQRKLSPYSPTPTHTHDLRKVSFNQEKGFFPPQYGNDFWMTDIHQWRYYILPKT